MAQAVTQGAQGDPGVAELTWGCSWGHNGRVPASCCRRRRRAGWNRCSAPASPPPQRAAPPVGGTTPSAPTTPSWDHPNHPASFQVFVSLPHPSRIPKGPHKDLGQPPQPGCRPTCTSMAVMSSTTRFMTARTLRGSTVPSQSRVSTLLRSICATAAPCTCT